MSTKDIQGDVKLYAIGEDGSHQEIGNLESVTITMEDAPKPKTIETLEDAARYAYGVTETRKEIEKITAVAASEISRWTEQIKEVENWQEEVLKPLREKLEYFNMLLTGYHVNQYYSAENEKAQAKLKSIKLPYGITLASKEQATKLEVVDDVALIGYAVANEQVDYAAPKARWAEIKKTLKVTDDGSVVDSNGEVVPFVKAVPQERKFEVR